jgi:predicted TIM-barrel fold metal-dependent hydrolase
MLCDAHVHFFSRGFLETLIKGTPHESRGAEQVASALGWDPPELPEALADRWRDELDRNGVARAALIASLPGDERSVAIAVARHPSRFVGFFMFNPVASDADLRLESAINSGMRGICLFPAMHGYQLDDQRVAGVFAVAGRQRAAIFVHCGALTVGVRRKLGLPSPFDWRLGDPLALGTVTVRFPDVPVIVPHFGAGFFREALMAADQCANIHLDTSSSNGWIKYHPGLTLDSVFRQALSVAGPERLLFGTDSSFYPRGWQKPIHAAQRGVLDAIGVTPGDQQKIFGENFNRLFPV